MQEEEGEEEEEEIIIINPEITTGEKNQNWKWFIKT